MAEKKSTDKSTSDMKTDEKPISDEIASNPKILAALSYFWVLSIVMYILKKDDKFIEFHSRQAMVLFVASFVGVIPVFGWVLAILIFVLALVGALKAYQGEEFKIPLAYELSEKINF